MNITPPTAAGIAPPYWRPHCNFSAERWDEASTAELAMFEAVLHGSRESCLVYVIGGRPDGACKVGITSFPDRRLRAVQAGMSQVFRARLFFHSFYIFADRTAARETEAAAHKRLSPFRSSVGEWFFVEPEVADEAVHVCMLRSAFPDDWEHHC